MQVTVLVRPGPAGRPGESDPAVQELRQAVADLGVELQPMHPGVRDPQLARYFVLEVPDSATAEQAIARLRGTPSVEAAYVKPAAEPP